MPFLRFTPRVIALSALGALVALSLVAAVSAANADGKSAATAIPLTNIATGSMTGSGAGSFAYYTFNYPGDGSVGTLGISITPNDPVTEGVVGAQLYQNGVQIANMNSVGNPPGTNAVTFSTTTPGPVLVQVYDYLPGPTVNYQLSLSGVNQATPAPAPTATPIIAALATPTAISSSTSGNGTPQTPFALSGSATGQLPGNSAGSFVYYTLPSTGDGQPHTLLVTFTPSGADVGNAVYVSVFQNGTQLTTMHGTDTLAYPNGTVPVTYASSLAGPLLIQIGNYNPTQTITYNLSQ